MRCYRDSSASSIPDSWAVYLQRRHPQDRNKRAIATASEPPVVTATQEILSVAEEADLLGQRILCALKKPDLVDRGGEEHFVDLVRWFKNTLGLGYCMVRNRGQQESICVPPIVNTAPWSALTESESASPPSKI